MTSADDIWLTRGQAAYIAGVTANTVKHWCERGWMAVDADGRPVRRQLRVRRNRRGWLEICYADLIAAERDTRTSGQSRRRPQAIVAA